MERCWKLIENSFPDQLAHFNQTCNWHKVSLDKGQIHKGPGSLQGGDNSAIEKHLNVLKINFPQN